MHHLLSDEQRRLQSEMFELQRKWEALGLVIPFFSSTATRTLGCFKISCESLRLVRGKIPTRWTADPDTIYEPQRRAGKSSQRHSSLVLSREHLSGMERRSFVTLDPWKVCAMLTSSLIRPHALCLSFPFHYHVHPALSRLSPVMSTPSTSYCGLSNSTHDNSFSTVSAAQKRQLPRPKLIILTTRHKHNLRAL